MAHVFAFRLFCSALAIASIFAVWYYFDASFVNYIFDGAEHYAKGIAKIVSEMSGMNAIVTEAILMQKMHLDRTLVVATLTLLWMVAIMFVFGGHLGYHLRRALLAFFFVHLILAIGWFMFTEQMVTWYDVHATAVKSLLRAFNLHKSETLVVKVLQMHSLIVFLEVILIYSILASRLEVRAVHRD